MHKANVRPRKRSWLAAVLVVTAVLACGEATTLGSEQQDEWAAAAVVGMHVRTEVRMLEQNRVTGVRSSHALLPTAILRNLPAAPPNAVALSRKGAPVVVRHFKTGEGKTLSLGIVPGKSGTPDLVYAFEDGSIRAIVSGRFEPHGRGFIRRKSRITYFKDGRPVLQVDRDADRIAKASRPSFKESLTHVLPLTRDIAQVLLPAPLHAQEIGETDCHSEWVSYGIASTLLASATTALTISAPGCITAPTPINPLCAAAGAAFTAFLSALDKWNVALDRLIQCEGRIDGGSELEPTTGGSGGTTTGGTSGSTTTTITQVVINFINSAIASGNYQCNESGDYCVYYAV